MVSFVCDTCQETLKKAKLDQHKNRCRYAVFSCIDCSTTFSGTEYRNHTSCISEAEKYQKSLYKGKTANSANGNTPSKDVPVKESKPVKLDANGTEIKQANVPSEKPSSRASAELSQVVMKILKKKNKLSLTKLKRKVIKKMGASISFEDDATVKLVDGKIVIEL